MKKKKELLFGVIALAICLIGSFLIHYFFDKDFEKQKEQVEETEYKIVEKESVAVNLAKLNSELANHKVDKLLNGSYLFIESEIYWYDIQEGIHLYVLPETFTGDEETDVAEKIGIWVA